MQGYAEVDPIVGAARQSINPVYWRHDDYSSSEQKLFWEHAKTFQLEAGVTFPLHGPNSSFGVLSLQVDARTEEAITFIRAKLPELSLLKDMIFHKALSLDQSKNSAPEVLLSSQEIEILKWSAIGKSSWDISKICNCSEANIDYHLKKIRSKFKVTTRRAAAVRAMALGIISF